MAGKIDFSQIWSLINISERILILNSKPDGDSIASSLAMKTILEKVGKKSKSISAFTLPDYLNFLFRKGEIEVCEEINWNNYDLIILLDSCVLERCAKNLPEKFEKNIKIIGIDHHIFEKVSSFEIIRIVDDDAESTAGILTDFLQFLESNLSRKIIDVEIAKLLYTGIVSDTDFFAYLNVSSTTHLRAAYLLSEDFDPKELIVNFRESLSTQAFKLIQKLIGNVIISREKKYAYLKIFKKDYEEFGLNIANEASNFILRTILRIINEVDFAFILREISQSKSSATFRSHNNGNNVDLSQIAAKLGGGGHMRASGVLFDGSIESLESSILKIIEKPQP